MFNNPITLVACLAVGFIFSSYLVYLTDDISMGETSLFVRSKDDS